MINTILLVLAIIALAALYYLYYNKSCQYEELKLRNKKDDEIKSSILAHIAAALRQPINVINEYCHTIETKSCEKLTNEERRNYLTQINKHNLMAYAYLEELQELTNFDGAVPVFSVIEVNVAELVMSYRREILPEVNRGVTVNIFTKESPKMRASLFTVIFRQLMLHLLGILVQRTKEGTITIDYACENEGLHFKVSGTGDPLPEEFTENMFTEQFSEKDLLQYAPELPFVKIDICRTVVEAFCGTIKALPEKEGKGTLFDFWIPCVIKLG